MRLLFSIPRSLLICSSLAFVLTSPWERASAQSYSQIAPKAPSSQATDSETSLPPAERARREHKPSEIFVDQLKGVIFHSRPSELRVDGTSCNGILNPGDVPFAARPDFVAVVKPYIGKPVSLDSLDRLTSAVVDYFREHDRPIVNVFVPAQNISNGYVQIIAVEGRVERVEAVGAKWFSNDDLKSELRTKPGEPVNNRQVLNDLDWLNANPFHLSNVVYGAGLAPDTTDVTLKTEDRFPARLYAGYEDSGNQSTGFDRYEVGFNWGDLFELGLDQQLNYQYTTSGNFDSLHAHSASYFVPLPWRHTLTIFGDYEDSKGLVPPVEHLSGRNYQISFRYGIPLPTYRRDSLMVHQNFSFGFDNKYNNNSLVFNSISVGNTLYEVDQFVSCYSLNEEDSYGVTSLNETLTESPGGFGGNNTDSQFNATHALAQSSYLYNTLVLERDTKLPENFSLVLRGTLQNSSGNLVPSEQLGFGGYNTIRGYDDREVNADEGYIFTTELRAPSFSLASFASASNVWDDHLQLLGFWDYGVAGNHSTLEGESDHTNLSSIGVGFRYNVASYVSVRFDYGFQLLRTGLDSEHGSRGSLGVTVSY